MIDNELQVRLLHAAKDRTGWKQASSRPKLGEVCLESSVDPNNSLGLIFKIKIGDNHRKFCRYIGSSTATPPPLTPEEDWDFTSDEVLPYFGNVITASGDLQVLGYYTYPDEPSVAETLRGITVIRVYKLSLVTTAGETVLSVDTTSYKEIRPGDKIDFDYTANSSILSISHEETTTDVTDNSLEPPDGLGDGERESYVITDVTTDSYGHITAYTKDKSTNLVAADITGKVDQSNTDIWRYRVTGDTVSINEDTASLNKLDGNTIVWNQLVQNGDFSGGSTGWVTDFATLTVSNNIATYLASAQYGYMGVNVDITSGHKYYISYQAKPTTVTSNVYVSIGGPGYATSEGLITSLSSTSTSGFTKIAKVGTFTKLSSDNQQNELVVMEFRASNRDSVQFKDFILIDLTLMFGAGNEPSTVAEFEKLFPLPYYAYNKGQLLNVNVNGLKTVGFNLWDEEWETGTILPTTGQNYAANDRIRSKNYIPVIEGQTYYFKNQIGFLYFYDVNKNFISCKQSSTSNVEYTMPVGCYYLRFISESSYGTTYNHDICINISDPNRNSEYEPYWSDTTSVPITGITGISSATGLREVIFPEGMKSAGTVLDEIGGHVNGYLTKGMKRLKIVDLGDLNYQLAYSRSHTFYATDFSDAKIDGELLSAVYVRKTRNAVYDGVDLTMWYGDVLGAGVSNLFIVNNAFSDAAAFKTAMSGVKLIYEIATPVTYTNLQYPDGRTFELPINYRVDDLGTEEWLPEQTSSAPINYPEATIIYRSNFKNAVLDTIDKVNNYKNPVQGESGNEPQTVGKVAVYDTTHSTESSDYSISNSTIDPSGTGNNTIVPTVDAVVNYIGTNTVQEIETDDDDDSNPTGLTVTHDGSTWNVSHQTIDTEDEGYIVDDGANIEGEEIVDLVTDVEVDDFGHITNKHIISSDKLIAADIKAPVIKTDNTTWNYRETGGNITIGEDTAKIPVLKGNTVVWNQLLYQLVQHITVSNIEYNITRTEATINGTASSYNTCTVMQNAMLPNNVYLIKFSKINTGVRILDTYGGSFMKYTDFIWKHSSYRVDLGYSVAQGSTVNNLTLKPIFVNLTKLFGSDTNICTALDVSDLIDNQGNLTTDTTKLNTAIANFEKLFPNSYYPYCEGRLVNLGGYGVKWNQICLNGNFDDGTSGWSIVRGSAIASNNTLTYTVSEVGSAYDNYISRSIFAGKTDGTKLYVSYNLNLPRATSFGVLKGGSYSSLSQNGSVGNNRFSGIITKVTSDNGFLYFGLAASTDYQVGDILKFSNIQVIDLTEMFGPGSEPTLEEFEAMFPNDYYEYNAGTEMNIFDAIGDKKLGLESTGFNLFDKDSADITNNKVLRVSDGVEVDSSTGFITPYIAVVGNTLNYYCSSTFNVGSDTYGYGFYDADKNYISGLASNTTDSRIVTVPTNARYLRATGLKANIDTGCINHSCDKNGTYEPYKKDTLDLDWIREIEYTPSGSSTPEKLFPYGLLSAGSVHDEVTGTKAIKRVGAVDLGSLDWTLYSNNLFYAAASSNASAQNNLQCSNYTTTSEGVTAMSDKTIRGKDGLFSSNNRLYIKDISHSIAPTPSDNWLSGVMLYYELATPVEIPLAEPHRMSYLVDDHGTEQQIPINVSSVINAPFVGTFEYKSNFKDTVIELIDKVNAYKNPVKGSGNIDQTAGKLAVYDTSSTIVSSLYGANKDATVFSGTDKDITLPTVQQVIDYVETTTTSALTYKGTISNNGTQLPTSGMQSGDLWIVADEYTYSDEDYYAGDFFVYNGDTSNWDIISGTSNVDNKGATLTFGSTVTIAEVSGTAVTIAGPTLNPSKDSSSKVIEFVTGISQNGNTLNITTKDIRDASTENKGIVALGAIKDNESDKVVTASDAKARFDAMDVGVGSLTSDGATTPTYTGTLHKTSYSNSAWGSIDFYPNTKYAAINDFATGFATDYPNLNSIESLTGTSGFLKKTAANTWTLTDFLYWRTEPSSPTYTTLTVNNTALTNQIHNYAGIAEIQKVTYVSGSTTIDDGFRIDIPILTNNSSLIGTVLKGKKASAAATNIPEWGQLSIEELSELRNIGDAKGYLKRKETSTQGQYTWELDPFGGGNLKPAFVNNTYVPSTTESSSTTTASDNFGLREQTGTNSYKRYKVPMTALCNDNTQVTYIKSGQTVTESVVIILNGNFS